jgi:hypothetical protein
MRRESTRVGRRSLGYAVAGLVAFVAQSAVMILDFQLGFERSGSVATQVCYWACFLATPVALTAAIVELPFIARLDSWTIVIGVLSFPAILVVDVIAVLNVYFFFGGSK